MSAGVERRRSPEERDARARRLLDVAADLLLRHGYRRVTVDDVAAGANVGKGTVYLHWQTREDLFRAVFEREVLRAIEELTGALRDDPRVALLHGFARRYFLAIMRRPLLRGFVLADADLLGKLATPRGGARESRHQVVFRAYVALLAERGLLRDGASIDAISYAFLATFEGFLREEATTAPADAPATLDQRADLLAQTVQRAFESGRRLPRAAQQSLATAVIGLLTELTAADRADIIDT